MFKTVDEYELHRTPEAPGVYAFHLCAIRPSTVGLSQPTSQTAQSANAAKANCLTILGRILALQQLQYQGHLREVNAYAAHGTTLAIEGQLAYTNYLHDQIDSIDPSDLSAFVNAVEALATMLPPVYVGIADRQSIQTRYKQHKRNHANRTNGTFGGRLADAGFRWSDILFSFVPATTLRLRNETLSALETYIHFFSRPKLGRS